MVLSNEMCNYNSIRIYVDDKTQFTYQVSL